jgi:disulfide oxidoreductase YuzD
MVEREKGISDNIFIKVGCCVCAFFMLLICCIEVSQYCQHKQYIKNTIENVTTHLSNKYPDKTFEIISEIDSETTYQFVEVIDERNEKYFVTTYADLSGEEGVNKTRDTVQYKEINNAITERFKNIFKLENISKDNFNKDLSTLPFPVNKKFTGDNLNEVIETTNFKDIEFRYNSADVNIDIESLPEEDKEFLNNFTVILITE